jgi:hypothetical protein
MLNIDEIYPHKDNEKIHPMNEKALERLCKIIQSKQGFTTPIKLDAKTKTKTITSGHFSSFYPSQTLVLGFICVNSNYKPCDS